MLFVYVAFVAEKEHKIGILIHLIETNNYKPTEDIGSEEGAPLFLMGLAGAVLDRGCCLINLFSNSVSMLDLSDGWN